jgi:hypothetical protein
MVAQVTLTHPVLVRIQAGQPFDAGLAMLGPGSWRHSDARPAANALNRFNLPRSSVKGMPILLGTDNLSGRNLMAGSRKESSRFRWRPAVPRSALAHDRNHPSKCRHSTFGYMPVEPSVASLEEFRASDV